jgi:Nif-specific regulatory protein
MEQRMQSLVEISNAINSILEVDRLLEEIMDRAITAVGVERGILFLKSSEGSLEARVARNVEKETLDNAEEVSRSIMNEVAASGRYFLSSNLQDDPNASGRKSVWKFKILSILCVPLISRDAIIGTIYLDSRKLTKVFTESDVTFMQTFANMAAIAIENATLYETTRKEASFWKDEAVQKTGFEGIVRGSAAMEQLCVRAQNVARTGVSVLITGESGTGKELIARAIHYYSPRREKRFIPINCSAMPEHILESELFGVRKGAFTGANSDKRGLFEEADGGTMFLDEIADMEATLQAKLLRVLQEGEVRRVGDTAIKHVDVRVISATNRDLAVELKEKRFREDLYYRLCGTLITIPPLRQRVDDILPMARHFLKEYCDEQQVPLKLISPDAIERLRTYRFPGNVRELQNIIRNAILFSGPEITPGDLALPESATQTDPEDFDEATRNHLVKVLEKVEWNQTRAAEILGLNRTTLQAKMKKLNISKP